MTKKRVIAGLDQLVEALGVDGAFRSILSNMTCDELAHKLRLIESQDDLGLFEEENGEINE